MNTPISDDELSRRWSAVRRGMAEHDLAAIVVSADNDYMGGYLKDLTDEPATTGYRVSLVFPGDAPTMVRHGAAGYDVAVPPNPLGFWRGPGRLRKVNSFTTVRYTDYYEGDLLVEVLWPYAAQRISEVDQEAFPSPKPPGANRSTSGS